MSLFDATFKDGFLTCMACGLDIGMHVLNPEHPKCEYKDLYAQAVKYRQALEAICNNAAAPEMQLDRNWWNDLKSNSNEVMEETLLSLKVLNRGREILGWNLIKISPIKGAK